MKQLVAVSAVLFWALGAHAADCVNMAGEYTAADPDPEIVVEVAVTQTGCDQVQLQYVLDHENADLDVYQMDGARHLVTDQPDFMLNRTSSWSPEGYLSALNEMEYKEDGGSELYKENEQVILTSTDELVVKRDSTRGDGTHWNTTKTAFKRKPKP